MKREVSEHWKTSKWEEEQGQKSVRVRKEGKNH